MKNKSISSLTLALAITLTVFAFAACGGGDSEDSESADFGTADTSGNSSQQFYTLIDPHSQNPSTEMGGPVAIDDMIILMENNNVSLTVLSMIGGSAAESVAFATEIKNSTGLIIPAVNCKISEVNDDEAFNAAIDQQVSSGKFDCMAEMLVYHAPKYSDGMITAPEIKVPLTGSRVTKVIDTCRSESWTVVLHIEFYSLTKEYGQSEREIYWTSLNTVLTANTDLDFILTHLAELGDSECRDLIDAHNNVCFTTNFRDLMHYCNGDTAENYNESDWMALIQDHPDRFVIALDRVYPEHWEESAYSYDVGRVQEKLKGFSSSIAEALSSNNAKTLWNLN